MNTEGQHLLLDLWFPENTNIEDKADELLSYISNKFTVVNSVHKDFEPQGRTEVLILSESHFTVHTYPEHNYISIDLYICNMEIDMHELRYKILKMIEPIDYRTDLLYRGCKNDGH